MRLALFVVGFGQKFNPPFNPMKMSIIAPPVSGRLHKDEAGCQPAKSEQVRAPPEVTLVPRSTGPSIPRKPPIRLPHSMSATDTDSSVHGRKVYRRAIKPSRSVEPEPPLVSALHSSDDGGRILGPYASFQNDAYLASFGQQRDDVAGIAPDCESDDEKMERLTAKGKPHKSGHASGAKASKRTGQRKAGRGPSKKKEHKKEKRESKHPPAGGGASKRSTRGHPPPAATPPKELVGERAWQSNFPFVPREGDREILNRWFGVLPYGKRKIVHHAPLACVRLALGEMTQERCLRSHDLLVDGFGTSRLPGDLRWPQLFNAHYRDIDRIKRHQAALEKAGRVAGRHFCKCHPARCTHLEEPHKAALLLEDVAYYLTPEEMVTLLLRYGAVYAIYHHQREETVSWPFCDPITSTRRHGQISLKIGREYYYAHPYPTYLTETTRVTVGDIDYLLKPVVQMHYGSLAAVQFTIDKAPTLWMLQRKESVGTYRFFRYQYKMDGFTLYGRDRFTALPKAAAATTVATGVWTMLSLFGPTHVTLKARWKYSVAGFLSFWAAGRYTYHLMTRDMRSTCFGFDNGRFTWSYRSGVVDSHAAYPLCNETENRFVGRHKMLMNGKIKPALETEGYRGYHAITPAKKYSMFVRDRFAAEEAHYERSILGKAWANFKAEIQVPLVTSIALCGTYGFYMWGFWRLVRAVRASPARLHKLLKLLLRLCLHAIRWLKYQWHTRVPSWRLVDKRAAQAIKRLPDVPVRDYARRAYERAKNVSLPSSPMPDLETTGAIREAAKGIKDNLTPDLGFDAADLASITLGDLAEFGKDSAIDAAMSSAAAGGRVRDRLLDVPLKEYASKLRPDKVAKETVEHIRHIPGLTIGDITDAFITAQPVARAKEWASEDARPYRATVAAKRAGNGTWNAIRSVTRYVKSAVNSAGEYISPTKHYALPTYDGAFPDGLPARPTWQTYAALEWKDLSRGTRAALKKWAKTDLHKRMYGARDVYNFITRNTIRGHANATLRDILSADYFSAQMRANKKELASICSRHIGDVHFEGDLFRAVGVAKLIVPKAAPARPTWLLGRVARDIYNQCTRPSPHRYYYPYVKTMNTRCAFRTMKRPRIDPEWKIRTIRTGPCAGRRRVQFAGPIVNPHLTLIPHACNEAAMRALEHRQAKWHAPCDEEYTDHMIETFFEHILPLIFEKHSVDMMTRAEWLRDNDWPQSKRDANERAYREFMLKLRRKDFDKKAFVKEEVNILNINKDPFDKGTAKKLRERCIQANQDAYNVAIAMAVKSVARACKKRWNGRDCPVLYACYNSTDLGNLIYERYGDGCINVSQSDFTAFDAHQRVKLLKAELRFYDYALAEVPEKAQILAWIAHQESTHGYFGARATEGCIEYSGKGRRASGMPNTSIGNTFINMMFQFFVLIHGSSVEDVKAMIKHMDMLLALHGDDMFSLTKDNVHAAQIEGWPCFELCGLPVTGSAEGLSLPDAEFLRRHIYDGLFEGDRTFVVLPQPGRILQRAFVRYAGQVFNEHDTHYYAYVVAQGLLAMFKNTPIITPLLVRVMELSDAVVRKYPKKMRARTCIDRYLKKRIKYWYGTSELSLSGQAQFRDRYCITPAEEADALLEIANMTKIECTLGAVAFHKFNEIDNFT